MISLKIKCFAFFIEAIGGEAKLMIPANQEIRIRQIKEQLAEGYPVLREEILASSIAVNQQFAENEAIFLPEDLKEVVLLPPASGG